MVTVVYSSIYVFKAKWRVDVYVLTFSIHVDVFIGYVVYTIATVFTDRPPSIASEYRRYTVFIVLRRCHETPHRALFAHRTVSRRARRARVWLFTASDRTRRHRTRTGLHSSYWCFWCAEVFGAVAHGGGVWLEPLVLGLELNKQETSMDHFTVFGDVRRC